MLREGRYGAAALTGLLTAAGAVGGYQSAKGLRGSLGVIRSELSAAGGALRRAGSYLGEEVAPRLKLKNWEVSDLRLGTAGGSLRYKGNDIVKPLNRILYTMEDAPGAPLAGSRQTAIDRAWAQEAELIRESGRGSRPWTRNEIDRILNGESYKDLGYTGHHINRVHDYPAWQGDPRNIEFLRQGKGQEHMRLGHPGGTRAVQPPGYLIDRESMLESLGGGIVDAP